MTNNNIINKVIVKEESYKCEPCNYITSDKSNFRRHTRSRTHHKNISMIANDVSEIIVPSEKPRKARKKILIHKCKCGKTFSHQPSLSRHMKTCTLIEIEKESIKDKKEMSDIKNIMIHLIKQNNTIMECNNSIIENNNTVLKLLNKL